ncbi:MAG: TetR/AcrR family transcriptional regulator [Bauldia sp.]|nr:TetR/AcrR family transcriptional regulator [Bauldia sp.]
MESSDARILEAAVRVFAEHGFRGSTTRRIAKAARVNEVTLFRRFPSKDVLIRTALEAQAQHTIAMLRDHAPPQRPADMRAELAAYLAIIFPAMLATSDAHRTAIGEWGRSPELDASLMTATEFVHDEMRAYLERAQAAGLLRPDVNPLVATQALLGGLLADVLMRDRLPERFPLEPAAAIDAYLDLFLSGAIHR